MTTTVQARLTLTTKRIGKLAGNDEEENNKVTLPNGRTLSGREIGRKRSSALRDWQNTTAEWDELINDGQISPVIVHGDAAGYTFTGLRGHTTVTLEQAVVNVAVASLGADWRQRAELQVAKGTPWATIEAAEIVTPCICGRMVMSEGTCVLCGHGDAHVAYRVAGGPQPL